MKSVNIIHNDRKYDLEITEKDCWKHLSQKEKDTFEANAQFQYEGRLFYIAKHGRRLPIPSFYVEGGSEDYIKQQVDKWLAQ